MRMNLSSWFAELLLIFLVSPMLPVIAESADDSVKPWFAEWFEPGLDTLILQKWEQSQIDLGWSVARIYTHKPNEGQRLKPKTIVAMLPKESASYPKAFNRLLSYLQDNFPGTRIILCNFYKKDENCPKVLELAQKEKADLIFTIGSESAAAAAKFYVGCGIPVVTCNNKDPVIMGLMNDTEKGSGTNIAYTTLNMTADDMYLWIRKFNPLVTQVAILYDSKHKAVRAAEVEPIKERFSQNRIEVFDVATTGPDKAMDELPILMPDVLNRMQQNDPDLVKSLFLVTSCTSIWEQPAMGLVAKLAGKCPVMSTILDAVDGTEDGALVGIGIDRATAAHLSSVYAGRILSGKSQPQTMPLGRINPPDIAISFKKVKQLGIAIPFDFFEDASFIYGYEGKLVRQSDQRVDE